MRFSINTVLVLAFALATGVVGCGDDDSTPAGTGGSGGTSGSGGSGATSGSGGSGGTSMECGTVTCDEFMMPPAIPDAGMGGLIGGALPIDLTPVHCCSDTNECGVNNSTLLGSNCLPRDAVGEPSTTCPTQDIMGFITLPACCRSDGRCGLEGNLMGTDLGIGCAETVELYTALMGGLAGGFITTPWTGGTCTYVGSTMDGGTGNDSGI